MATPPDFDPGDPLADGLGSLHGDGASLCTSRPTSVRGDADVEEQLFGFGGRKIKKPFQSREDVGEISILSGNFGAERSDRRKREYTRENLKASPATIIGLQEAEDGVAQILGSPVPVGGGAAASTVVGQASDLPTAEAHAVAGQAVGCRDISERPQARFLVIMGEEFGTTCLTAVRATMASEINRLKWWWRFDGTWTDHGQRRNARSRVLITEINWRRRTALMDKLVHANVHLHHKTAKKHTGFAEAHQTFWKELYAMIVLHEVNIMSGDFNMSVFLVISILRSMGLIIDLGAIYPWKQTNRERPFSDSCAIFLIGGCQRISLQCSLASYSDHGGGSGSASGSAQVAPADAEQGGGSNQELAVFNKGQGYDLTAFLPSDRKAFAKVLEEMFTVSTDIDPALNTSPHLLPKWKQKLVQRTMFDPNDEFFRSGAHMPLLGFLGNNSNRSAVKLREREKRAMKS